MLLLLSMHSCIHIAIRRTTMYVLLQTVGNTDWLRRTVKNYWVFVHREGTRFEHNPRTFTREILCFSFSLSLSVLGADEGIWRGRGSVCYHLCDPFPWRHCSLPGHGSQMFRVRGKSLTFTRPHIHPSPHTPLTHHTHTEHMLALKNTPFTNTHRQTQIHTHIY